MGRKNIDMLNGSLWDKVLLYAIPLALTGMLQQLFNAADVAVVGRFAGTEAMAAVGANTSLVGLIVNLMSGMSLGVNVVLANAIGRGDPGTIRRGTHTSLITAVIGGLLLAIGGQFLVVWGLSIIGVPAEVMDMAVIYLRIYLAGLPVMFLYNIEAAVYRAIGDTRTPLLVLMAAGVINLILNVVMVCGLHMDAAGVAIATVVSNAISAVLLLLGLMKSETAARVSMEYLQFDGRIFLRVLQIGVPAAIQSMVFSFSNLIIQASINSLGAITMAGSTAAYNLECLAWYMLNSFGQTCTTFVGQNDGAGNQKRCVKVLFTIWGIDYVMTFLMMGTLVIFGRQFLYLFNTDPEVIEVGMIRLRWIALTYVFSTSNELLSGYLRGYGKSLGPAIAGLITICGVRLTWILTMFPKYPSFPTVMKAFPMSLCSSMTAVGILVILYHIRLRKEGKI